MLGHIALSAAWLAAGALAGADVVVRNAPGKSTAQTLHAIRDRLIEARQEGQNEVFSNSTDIDSSFSNIVLLRTGRSITSNATLVGDNELGVSDEFSTSVSIEITCKTCIIKGTAHAELTVGTNGTFGASQIFQNVTEQFDDAIDEITDAVTDFGKQVWSEIDESLDTGDFDMPPLNLELSIDVPEMPETRLKFGFDELEMYIDLETTLSGSASYELNLYTSQGPFGFGIGEELMLGIVFSVDLILSVDAAITIGTGFHLRLDDGFSIELAMFAEEVATLEMNGGQFEFLPVTVETDGIVLKALLRLGMFSGFTLKTPSFISDFEIAGHSIPSAGGGIEASVYANLAELTMNITLPDLAPSDDEDDDEDEEVDCHLRIVQEFQVGLGAVAGATVFLDDKTWGPAPSTYTPIYYTTLLDACALAPSPTPTLQARQDDEESDNELSTTTTETEKVYTGTQCLSTGLANCPNSLQSVHKYTVIETLSTAVPSGDDVDWDAVITKSAGPLTATGFGEKALSLLATTGKPVSYVPPPPEETEVGSSGNDDDNDDDDDDTVGGVSKAVIIGVSVGLGVPLLLGIAGGIFFCLRRRRNKTTAGTSVTYSAVPDPYNSPTQGTTGPAKNMDVSEQQR